MIEKCTVYAMCTNFTGAHAIFLRNNRIKTKIDDYGYSFTDHKVAMHCEKKNPVD